MATQSSSADARARSGVRSRESTRRSPDAGSSVRRKAPAKKTPVKRTATGASGPAAGKAKPAPSHRKPDGNGGTPYPGRQQGRQQAPQKPADGPQQPQATPQPTSDSTPESAPVAWTVREGEVGIRVRMYRVGFGDFFLLSFMKPDGSLVHVIIDCGVFKGTSQTGDIDSIEAAVANMLEVTRRNVALIVMTHRHADHIAGFARCAKDFKSLTVQGVWMPIWESEYDSTALKYQAELTRTALGLHQHFATLASPSQEENTARKYLENALGATEAAARGTNSDALNLLKRELNGAKVSYYKGGDPAQIPQALQDAGLSAQILGPPAITDVDMMKLMDLQKGVGQYLAHEDTPEETPEEAQRPPFGAEWEFKPENDADGFSPLALRDWVEPKSPWRIVERDQMTKGLTQMKSLLQSSLPMASLLAAKQLNSFLNNQSLVVLFTFKGRKLLFVGDAQAGNWEHWLFGTDTPDKTASGTMAAQAREILTSIDFYKVGHHGSGNATPKAAVAAMTSRGRKFAAMCSTEAGVYGTEDPDDPSKGTEVPRIPLLQQLSKASALVRSDQIAIKANGTAVEARVSASLPAAVTGRRFDKGLFWIDCYL